MQKAIATISLAGLASAALSGYATESSMNGWSSSAASSTSSAPAASGTPECWSACYKKNGVTSESSLCGNDAVSACIHDTCDSADDQKYWSWYDSYCKSTTTSTSTSSSSSWATTTSDCETTTTSTKITSTVTASPTPSVQCWSECFKEANIQSESQLCGNTQVDQCIQDKCSAAEDKAYWAWYESFCPAASSTSTATSVKTYTTSEKQSTWVYTTTKVYSYPVTGTSTGSSESATATQNCWDVCFQKAGISSESALCGNTEVDSCIHDTCSSEMDQAYWNWYNSFCSPATSTYTTSTAQATTWSSAESMETSTYQSTWEVTTSMPSTPKAPSTATTLPSPPASVWSAANTASANTWGATNTATWATSAASTGWNAPTASASYPVGPVATGGAAINKPAAIAFAGALLAFL